MKKLLSMLLAVMMLATMAFGTVAASAEDAIPEGATKAHLFFCDFNEGQHGWRPISSPDVLITGDGHYTVTIEYDPPAAGYLPDAANSLMSLFIVVEDGGASDNVMSGKFLGISEIRANGQALELKGTAAYGSVSWEQASWRPGSFDAGDGVSFLATTYRNDPSTPPGSHKTWNGDAGSAQIVDLTTVGEITTIAVDFFVTGEMGVIPTKADAEASAEEEPAESAPAEKPEAPAIALESLPVPEVTAPPAEEVIPDNATNARIFFLDYGGWPATAEGFYGASTEVTITGDGYYTCSAKFLPMNSGWVPSGGYNTDGSGSDTGGMQFMLIVEDAGKLWDSSIGEWGAWAHPVDTVMSDKYLGISEVRINGEPIPMNGTAVMDSPQWTEGYYHAFNYTDAYVILDHSAPPTPSNTHPTWDGSPAARPVVDLSTVGAINTIEVDFFVTSTQGEKPAVEEEVPEAAPAIQPFWSGKNTVGLAGLELRDLGIADDWHTVVPVDLTKEGWSVYPLLVSNAYIIGNAYVCVHNGEVSVTVDYVGNSHTYIIEYSECVKWFTDLDDITPEALISIDDGLTCADVVSIADDLGGADLAYLSINNKVSYRTPINKTGGVLPRYWRDQAQWIAHLDALKAMIPAE